MEVETMRAKVRYPGLFHPEGQNGLLDAVRRERLIVQTYSPELIPIDMAFAKLKADLRRAAERTVEGLREAVALTFETFKPQEC